MAACINSRTPGTSEIRRLRDANVADTLALAAQQPMRVGEMLLVERNHRIGMRRGEDERIAYTLR